MGGGTLAAVPDSQPLSVYTLTVVFASITQLLHFSFVFFFGLHAQLPAHLVFACAVNMIASQYFI